MNIVKGVDIKLLKLIFNYLGVKLPQNKTKKIKGAFCVCVGGCFVCLFVFFCVCVKSRNQPVKN